MKRRREFDQNEYENSTKKRRYHHESEQTGYWNKERDKQRNEKKKNFDKSFDHKKFLLKRKLNRESIDMNIIAKSVFANSPIRKNSESNFVYDISDSDDEEKNLEREEKHRKPSKKQKLTQKQLLELEKINESYVGPKRLKEFEEEMNFSNMNLLDGEGQAMAKFIAQNKRIPKRGELLPEEKINELEDLGYVMSGSRNRRMSTVGKEKEGLVLNVYEKYKLDMEKFMDRQKGEMQVRSKLRKLIEEQKIKEDIL